MIFCCQFCLLFSTTVTSNPAVFFEHIVHVCLFVGQMSLQKDLLPYVEQALNDVEETVIVNATEFG